MDFSTDEGIIERRPGALMSSRKLFGCVAHEQPGKMAAT
jgi:hypothetical protein